MGKSNLSRQKLGKKRRKKLQQLRDERLPEERWDKIARLYCDPTAHTLDVVPFRGMSESFLHYYFHVERNYMPRFIDRYAFIVLTAAYTWADYIDIVPGYWHKRDQYPTVILESEKGLESSAKDVDRLIRDTLKSELLTTTYVFIESKNILIELREDFTVVFYGLGDDEERMIQSLADANGLFLKRGTEDRTTEDCLNETMPTTYPGTGWTISSLVLPERFGGFPETDTRGGS
ncbi:hypothetical protein JKI95_01160 [Corynebacterium aquatimens]|uniref:hypothetical protein n=1 Tax=Corynebacterium TaxID=1716 RepID=UPI001F253BC2|nr:MULTISPECIES: hypothetical protein [Corynebacterium]QYH19796.1 hypothetical protein JKI95_01160 [Corynebacterium aquatimens]UIZ93076.1 hypothetical protein JZY91_04945 [Corynebacterium sp. CNCTC7651]